MSHHDCHDWDYGDSDKDPDEGSLYRGHYPRHYSSDRERAYGGDRGPPRDRGERRQRGDRHRDGEYYGPGEADRDRYSHPQRRGGYDGERGRYCPRDDYETNRRDYDGGRREFDRRDSRYDMDQRCVPERRPRQTQQEKESELRRRGGREYHGGTRHHDRHGNKDMDKSPRGQTTCEPKEEPPLPPIPGQQPSRSQDFCGRPREYGSPQQQDQDQRTKTDLCPPESKPPTKQQQQQQPPRQTDDGGRGRGPQPPPLEPAHSRGKCVPSPEPGHSRGKSVPAPEPAPTARHDSPIQIQQQPQQQSQHHIQHNQQQQQQQQQQQPPPRKENPPQEPRLGRFCGKNIPLIQCNLGEWRIDGKISKKKHTSYTVLKEEEGAIPRHASVLLPVLEESERIFHELVAAGDVAPTRAFLQDHPDFNINCVNYHKVSAFHVAVKQQNEAMVEFLLQQKNLDIADGALYAIKAGNLRIVEMIFERICELSPGLEFAGTTHSVDFVDDLTPIVLAAQLGNYEIINFLIKRGHTIPPVHPPFCKCDACRADLKKYDRLRYSTMKLNLYKAICNPMYIFQTTDDPFQRAFELVKELEDAATVFPQFKVSFEDLWQSLRRFTTELIGCCRNAQEVEIVLKKSPKSVADHVKFPRLQYAIDLKQKEFVSHPYTQAVLGDAWTGELLEWKIRSPLMQSLSVLPRIPMLPIMTVMCILLPNHSLVRKWKTPVNKMISSVASYLIFLIIIFLESNLDKQGQKRGPPNSGLEGIIIIYVIGYIWLNIRICFKQGIKRFFSTMWHWYDTIMLFMFTMTIIFWIASWVDITANDDIDLPRKYWNAMDPELIAEGFFAAAVIMAFFRLNLFLSLNYHLGPLQVSIGKMTLDIFRFIIIFFIIILAWCAGLCRFYQPYEGMVQKDAASGNTTTQVPSFVSFLMTLKTFFWAIFGMSPIESADVVIENLPGDTPGTTIINKHQFTEAVGYIAFALFQFLSVVVVLNMLVACMANTFTKVIDNVTVEWVFGRSQIYLSFMASSMLPPPFNLVPTGAGLKDMFRWFRLLAKPSDGQKARCSLAHCCYIESETEAYVNNEFPSLMSELAQRYIRFKSEVHEEERNTLDDIRNEINEVKESIRKLTASGYYRRC